MTKIYQIQIIAYYKCLLIIIKNVTYPQYQFKEVIPYLIPVPGQKAHTIVPQT